MWNTMKKTLLLLAALAMAACTAQANEETIRKNLGAQLPKGLAIDEVRPSPVAGLWEVRFGGEIRYTDAQGLYLVDGEILDLKNRRNLTQERMNKLSAVDFSTLPLKDAIVWKKGDGSRRIAVFADPNCGYCKRFERSLQDAKDVTVYTFVLPILGGDSPDKSRAAWCAKDATVAWRNWMLDGTALPKPAANCDSAAIDRNIALSRKHNVTGTPAIVFEDGSRAPGALSAEQLEERLKAAAGAGRKS